MFHRLGEGLIFLIQIESHGILKIGLAAVALASVGLGYFSLNGKSATEKWHAQCELDPKADFKIEDDRPLPSTRYVADTAHSSILFKASHWKIVDIVGWFGDHETVMLSNKDDFTDAVIEARIRINTVCMPNRRLQAHINKRRISTQISSLKSHKGAQNWFV